MSSAKQIMANDKNTHASSHHRQCEDHVVTDSVHERFRQIHVRCDDCNSDIVGNEAAIKKHFNNLHPSNRNCRYCKGKVFVYRKITITDNSEKSQNYVYHKCEYREQLERNTPSESM